MKVATLMRSAALLLAAAVAVESQGFEYNVRRPSWEIRPELTGAAAGKWTMDYEAAQSAASAAGKCHIMFVTGSWWCPHCEAFEEKVLLSDAWRRFLSDNGFYLSMLDFPYRGTVSEDQEWKSAHPEMGPGWGFKCWLYDDDYLAENGLTREDGFRMIQSLYEKQKSLAPETASQVTIKTWDGAEDFTYGKVGYPTLIVYLPDGTEAGRFIPYVTNMDAPEAREFVLGQIKTIIDDALSSRCALCSDPEEGGLSGESAQIYRGWLTGGESGLAGVVEVKTSRASRKGEIKVKAVMTLEGRKTTFWGETANGFEPVTLLKTGSAPGTATLRFGTEGLSGTCTADGVAYEITGARDVFAAPRSDVAAKARAGALQTGSWNFVMRPGESDAPFAGGFGALTVTVRSKGKAKISGKLGDGTRVNVSGQLIAGEDGAFSLPVVANLYAGKKGGFSCNLWFRNGWLFNISDIGDWKCTARGGEFRVGWSPIYTAAAGYGEISPDMELLFEYPPEKIDGRALVVDPEADSVTARGTAWKGTGLSNLSLRLSAKTGIVSGQMYFLTEAAPRPKRVKAGVYGVVVGNTAYVSVAVRNIGSWAAKVSACAACED